MHESVLDTLGSPLVRVGGVPGATVAAKLESRNPGGSAKDRPAMAMVEAAERDGTLEPGDHIVEATSGNTGIGIALVAAAKGYDCTVVMPASKSPERRAVMRAYGADLELVDGDISDANDRADELEAEGAVQLNQFENPSNPEAHYETTGPELLDQLDGRTPDAFVAGVGTGGTLSGVGRRLREQFPSVEIVAVEPADNAVLSGGDAREDSFQGMGPGFVSPNLAVDLVDSVETVTLDVAERECRRLAREEGVLVGQSSGASNVAARRVAERVAEERGTTTATTSASASTADARTAFVDRPSQQLPVASDATDAASGDDAAGGGDGSGDDDGSTDRPLVVTVFWDSGERYLSTGLFDD
ncbi:PLP-dependent cysteine synthase family protein [Halomarina oriensis]|uniref:Pyridoxal-phosphate dependent enzyme n=1 Tax=Halomarina oriensis TaxID=671145 RepID=A0A6B0GQE2_9EURY|nr:PLP-dependent cysteine synthase family protein [Halomarina oriensis]MWG33878.1 pyridoxal-phosphate dependent enzyme [Halomarina oriensis]